MTEHLLARSASRSSSLDHPDHVARRIAKAQTLAESAHRPVAVLLHRDLMWEEHDKAIGLKLGPLQELERRANWHNSKRIEAMQRLERLKSDLSAAGRLRGGDHHGRRGGGAAVDRAPAELLLPPARDGPRVVDGARDRAVAAGEAGGRLRRRRIDPDEPRRADDAGALPAAKPGPRRLRQREPACRSAAFRPRRRPAAISPPSRQRRACRERARRGRSTSSPAPSTRRSPPPI